MEPELLTVNLVEEIQNAVDSGIGVESVVRGIREATLPGLIEYGCLRWATGLARIPSLPPAVLSSALGTAMLAVPSQLGVRSTGEPTKPPDGIGTQPAEFFVLRTKEELETTEWGSFEIRFNRSARSVGFAELTGDGLHAALREMTENALLHADSPVPILIGYRVLDGVAQFSVADVGRGVLASLRTSPDYENLRLHRDAIREALKDGASRYGHNKGGLGFRRVFKALTAQWGQLRFRSGEGCVTMDGTDLAADMGQEHFPPFLPGFQVTITCRSSPSASSCPLV